MRQKPNETVDAFIERWRSEANKCRALLSEEEQVQLCRNGIRDYISLLVSEQITSFRLLANEACKKERILAQRDERMKQKDVSAKPQKKDKGGNSANVTEVKEGGKSSRKTEEPEPNYPFKNEEVSPILLQLLERSAIELPPPRFPNEVDRVNDPRYCHYHRGVNHPTGECNTLNKILFRCMEKGIIRTKTSHNASSNNVSVAEELAWGQGQALGQSKAPELDRKEAQPADDAWDFVCPKEIPEMPRQLRRRRSRRHKKELQKKKELRKIFPYPQRFFRWSSRYQPTVHYGRLSSGGEASTILQKDDASHAGGIAAEAQRVPRTIWLGADPKASASLPGQG